MKTLAIDFDGVIHNYNGWKDGTIYGGPIEGAFEAILKLQGYGYSIVVHTARDTKQVRDWLWSNGFTAVASNDIGFWDVNSAILVSNKKPAAIAYIDDRAFKFNNWEEVLKEFTE